MDKGIRTGVNFEFNRLLPTWKEMGGKLPGSNFRHAVVAWAVENYGVTWSSGCTHYNHSLIEAKKLRPELCEGLGRPEGKKGGRKSNASKVANAVTLLLGYTPAAEVGSVEFIDQQFVDQTPSTLLSVGVKEHTSTHTVVTNPIPEAKTFTVTRSKDGVVVAEGLVLADAEALVAKAKAAKKATLVFA